MMATAKNVYIRAATIKKLEDIIRLNPTDGVASSIIDTAVTMYLDKLQNKETDTSDTPIQVRISTLLDLIGIVVDKFFELPEYYDNPVQLNNDKVKIDELNIAVIKFIAEESTDNKNRVLAAFDAFKPEKPITSISDETLDDLIETIEKNMQEMDSAKHALVPFLAASIDNNAYDDHIDLILNKDALRAAIITLTSKSCNIGPSYNEKMETLINAVTEFVTTFCPDKKIDSKLLNSIFDALSVFVQTTTPSSQKDPEPIQTTEREVSKELPSNKFIADKIVLRMVISNIICKFFEVTGDYVHGLNKVLTSIQNFMEEFDEEKWNTELLDPVIFALEEFVVQKDEVSDKTDSPTTFEFELEPWETKVIQEKKELDEKINELAGILTKQIPAPPELSNVNSAQLGLLQQQYSAMLAQTNILNDRILVFMVDKVCNKFNIQSQYLNKYTGMFQSPNIMGGNYPMNQPYPFNGGHPMPRFRHDPWVGTGNCFQK